LQLDAGSIWYFPANFRSNTVISFAFPALSPDYVDAKDKKQPLKTWLKAVYCREQLQKIGDPSNEAQTCQDLFAGFVTKEQAAKIYRDLYEDSRSYPGNWLPFPPYAMTLDHFVMVRIQRGSQLRLSNLWKIDDRPIDPNRKIADFSVLSHFHEPTQYPRGMKTTAKLLWPQANTS
jgi:hypothetical protein